MSPGGGESELTAGAPDEMTATVAPPRRSTNGAGPSRSGERGRREATAGRPALAKPASESPDGAFPDGGPPGQPDMGAEDDLEPATARASCTLAQMRRFIKSRPYIPVHELRRRFLIEGLEDEVSPMSTGQATVFIGLPEREAGFLGELIRAGEVGCELLLDPTSPSVVGVFPMRPVARQ